jgi:hypothetical protein
MRVPRGADNRGDGIESAPVKDHLIKTFTINYQSELDGHVYEGQFTTKKMSIKDMGRLGVVKSQLNGGYYFNEDNPGVGIDETTDATNNMLAHFEICLLQKPSWWNLDEIYDLGILGAVYRKIVDFENSFFRSARSKEEHRDDGSGSRDRQEAEPRSGVTGPVTEVGGGEVQPSLDP